MGSFCTLRAIGEIMLYISTTKDTEHFGPWGAVVKVFTDDEREKAEDALAKFKRRYGNIFRLTNK